MARFTRKPRKDVRWKEGGEGGGGFRGSRRTIQTLPKKINKPRTGGRCKEVFGRGVTNGWGERVWGGGWVGRGVLFSEVQKKNRRFSAKLSRKKRQQDDYAQRYARNGIGVGREEGGSKGGGRGGFNRILLRNNRKRTVNKVSFSDRTHKGGRKKKRFQTKRR